MSCASAFRLCIWQMFQRDLKWCVFMCVLYVLNPWPCAMLYKFNNRKIRKTYNYSNSSVICDKWVTLPCTLLTPVLISPYWPSQNPGAFPGHWNMWPQIYSYTSFSLFPCPLFPSELSCKVQTLIFSYPPSPSPARRVTPVIVEPSRSWACDKGVIVAMLLCSQPFSCPNISPWFIFSTNTSKTLFDKSSFTPLQAIHLLRWYGHYMANKWTVVIRYKAQPHWGKYSQTVRKSEVQNNHNPSNLYINFRCAYVQLLLMDGLRP